MSRTLVVLGGSADQMYLIRTAQHMGFEVLCLDVDAGCPGARQADGFAAISTRDVPALCSHLDTLAGQGGELAGVITMGSDIPDVVAALSEHLGTPGISRETARLATDKLAMKQRFRERGVPCPWFSEIGSAADLRSLLQHRPRLVLKPIDRSGSRGVFLVDSGCDVERLFRSARDFSFGGRVMVEEYLNGPQLSTESLLLGDWDATPGFADRNYDLLERFRPQIMENGGWIPSALAPEERRDVERVAVQAARALGITHGVAKGDLVLTAQGPQVIEIAARLSGGDFCESLVPLGTGVDYVRAAIRLAVGEDPDPVSLEPEHERAVANRYFFPAAGRLLAVEGVDEVRARPWVEKLELWYEPGDEVPPSLSHAHRFGVFVATAPDRESLEDRVAWVYDTIRIVTEPWTPASECA